MKNVLLLLLGAVILSNCSRFHTILFNQEETFAETYADYSAEGEGATQTKTSVLLPAVLTRIRRFGVSLFISFLVYTQVFWCIAVLLMSIQ